MESGACDVYSGAARVVCHVHSKRMFFYSSTLFSFIFLHCKESERQRQGKRRSEDEKGDKMLRESDKEERGKGSREGEMCDFFFHQSLRVHQEMRDTKTKQTNSKQISHKQTNNTISREPLIPAGRAGILPSAPPLYNSVHQLHLQHLTIPPSPPKPKFMAGIWK